MYQSPKIISLSHTKAIGRNSTCLESKKKHLPPRTEDVFRSQIHFILTTDLPADGTITEDKAARDELMMGLGSTQANERNSMFV